MSERLGASESRLVAAERPQGLSLLRRELRTHVGPAHAARRVSLWVVDPVGVVALNKRTMRGGDSPELFRNLRVEKRGVQVGAHFAYDESRPSLHEPFLLKRYTQQPYKTLEALHVREPTGHLLRAHLVGDGSDAQALALGFGVLHELHGALDDNPHVQRLASRETWVYGGVYVEQRVTGLQAGGHRALHFVHGFGKLEFGLGMGILEPGTAVVQAGVEGRAAPVFLGECAHAGDVPLGGPSSVSAVTVDLIKGGGEQHRCPSSGRYLDRRL